MASSTLPFLTQATTLFHPTQTPPTLSHSSSLSFPLTHHKLINLTTTTTSTKCTTNTTNNSSLSPPPEPEDDDFPTPSPENEATTPPENFPIEKRRKSEIIRDRKSRTQLEKPEPPNFEIGWKRTKPLTLEKPTGYVIMDFLDKFEDLMSRDFGSKELLAKAGEIVAERAREEAEDLRDDGKVDDRMVTELSRVLKLMEMDLAMVKAAYKEETLYERLQQARARCRQAILVVKSF